MSYRPDSAARRLASLAQYRWSSPEPFRVHHYDPKRRGTWHAYFSTLEAAEAFAVDKPLWGRAAIVETKDEKEETVSP